jgi:hypothetical protein
MPNVTLNMQENEINQEPVLDTNTYLLFAIFREV